MEKGLSTRTLNLKEGSKNFFKFPEYHISSTEAVFPTPRTVLQYCTSNLFFFSNDVFFAVRVGKIEHRTPNTEHVSCIEIPELTVTTPQQF